MSAQIDRRLFIRGPLTSAVGIVLGKEIKVIAAQGEDGTGAHELCEADAEYCPMANVAASPLPTPPPSGRFIYVAPDGDDALDGLTWEARKQTLAASLLDVRAGDTVLVSPGRYTDYVQFDLPRIEGEWR